MPLDPDTGIICENFVDIPDEFVHQVLQEAIFKDVQKDLVCETEFATGAQSTYGWVLDRYRRVARWLLEQGVGVGDRVSFYSKCLLEYTPCALAILRIGATLTYLRPEMIRDSEYRASVGTPRFVFASVDRLEELVNAGFENIIVYRSEDVELPPSCYAFEELAGDYANIADEVDEPDLEIPGSPSSVVALMTFTGGTTGNPKPIQLTHKALRAVLEYEKSGSNLVFGQPVENPVQLSMFPTEHVTGVIYRVFSLVYHPHTVVLDASPPSSDICKAVETHGVNVITTFPVNLISLLRYPERSEYDLSSWKNCVVVGGPLSPSIQHDLQEEFNLDALQLRLAMSECSGAVMVPGTVEGSVGRLCPNTEAIVRSLDDGSPLTTPGEVGELYIRAPQCTIGYYNLPEKTAAVIDDEGFLQTGDLVSFDADYNFYYFDRVQEFISHPETGQMISATELELIIAYVNPSVLEVSVISSPNGPRAIIVPTEWPEDESTYKDEIVEKTNDYITDEWKWLTGGVFLLNREEVPRTVLGKHMKRKMTDL